MNGEEFEKSIHALHERLLQLTATKGAEYTQGRDNRFDNFERQAEALGLTREQVLLVFLNKHLDSITTYVKDRALDRERKYSEPMTGRVDDAILYLLLLRGMIQKNTAPLYEQGGVIEAGDLLRSGEVGFLATEPRRVSMDVGGVTTAARTVEVELRSAADKQPGGWQGRHVVISAHHPAAVKACQSIGLVPGTFALSSPDQLFKIGRGDMVTCVSVGSPDCRRLLSEVKQRAADQGFTLVEMTG